MEKITCRIEYIGDGQLTVRLPAEDICRIHMQLELLKAGKLKELVLQDADGGSISVSASLIGLAMMDNIIEMLEQAFMTRGDISWMHTDARVCADGRTIDVAVGFFY